MASIGRRKKEVCVNFLGSFEFLYLVRCTESVVVLCNYFTLPCCKPMRYRIGQRYVLQFGVHDGKHIPVMVSIAICGAHVQLIRVLYRVNLMQFQIFPTEEIVALGLCSVTFSNEFSSWSGLYLFKFTLYFSDISFRTSVKKNYFKNYYRLNVPPTELFKCSAIHVLREVPKNN